MTWLVSPHVASRDGLCASEQGHRHPDPSAIEASIDRALNRTSAGSSSTYAGEGLGRVLIKGRLTDVSSAPTSGGRRTLLDLRQTCFGLSGGFAPVSLPLFHGTRFAAGVLKFSLSCMVALLC